MSPAIANSSPAIAAENRENSDNEFGVMPVVAITPAIFLANQQLFTKERSKESIAIFGHFNFFIIFMGMPRIFGIGIGTLPLPEVRLFIIFCIIR